MIVACGWASHTLLASQTMFLHTNVGFTNCEDEALADLMNSLVEIEPDIIQIDTPYRPSGEKFLELPQLTNWGKLPNVLKISCKR